MSRTQSSLASSFVHNSQIGL